MARRPGPRRSGGGRMADWVHHCCYIDIFAGVRLTWDFGFAGFGLRPVPAHMVKHAEGPGLASPLPLPASGGS